jgi:hypothetical protein
MIDISSLTDSRHVAKLLAEGWRFIYDPSSSFIFARKASRGLSFTVCELNSNVQACQLNSNIQACLGFFLADCLNAAKDTPEVPDEAKCERQLPPNETVSFNPSDKASIEALLDKYGPEGVFEIASALNLAVARDIHD